MSMAAKTGVIFRRIGGRIIPIVKNVGIGAASGYVTGRVVTDISASHDGGRAGAKIGALVGAMASIPPRPVGRAIYNFASKYRMGYKASKAAEAAAKMKK